MAGRLPFDNALHKLFLAFCHHGTNRQASARALTTMDEGRFSKFCLDCEVVDGKVLSPHDVTLAFQRVLSRRTSSRFAGLSQASNAARLDYSEALEALRFLAWTRYRSASPSRAHAFEVLAQAMLDSPAGQRGGPTLNTTTRTATSSGVFARLTDARGFTGTHQSRSRRLQREAARITAQGRAALTSTMMDSSDIQAVIGSRQQQDVVPSPVAAAGRGLMGAPQRISRHRRVSMTAEQREAAQAARRTRAILADFGDPSAEEMEDAPPPAGEQQEVPSGAPVPPPPPFTWSGFLAAPIKTTKEQWAANKALFKSYGTFAITVYAGVYVTTLGLIYSLLHFGLVEGPDVNALLNGWSVKKYFTESDIELSPFWTRFLTAWLLTKTTEPLRMIGTAAALPVLVRYTPARVLQLFGINKADSSAAIGRMVTRAAHARTAVRARVNMARERAGAGANKVGGASEAGKGGGSSPGPSER